MTNQRRVLFLASSAPRFAGDATAPFILNMAEDLNSIGWQIEILAPHVDGARRREVLNGITIHRFQYLWPARWQTLCYNGGAAVNLRRNPLNALAIPFLVMAEFIAAFLLVVRRSHALVHSHWIIPQGVIGQLLSFGGRVHVVSVHGADVYGFRGRLAMALKRWVIRRCDHVVVNSTSTRREVEALHHFKEISLIPTGTTPCTIGDARTLDSASAEDDVRTIIYVGRLIEPKGVSYLIEAMQLILKETPARLLIVGDGPDRGRLERLAAEMGISHACQFVGQVPHSRIYEFFSSANVFVGPSLDVPGEWTEAQGNTFAEALFAGIPVVASRVGGIPDAVIHERTGLLVDERSPEQIASAVLRILSDAKLAAALRQAGRRHAEEHFSRFSNARRLSELYERLLSSRSRA